MLNFGYGPSLMMRAMTSPESRCSADQEAARTRGWMDASGPGWQSLGQLPMMRRRWSDRSSVVSNSLSAGMRGKYPGSLLMTSGGTLPIGGMVPPRQARRIEHATAKQARVFRIVGAP